MPRIVSVWLKAWPIARLLLGRNSAAQAETVDPLQPLVLVAPGKGGVRIVALNRAAEDAGLTAGDLLSNARSKVRNLQARDADPAADAAALRRLALWALRYTPTVTPWDATGGATKDTAGDATTRKADSGADGLFLDITGCAHLFGGEEALLHDLEQRLRGFGLRPRLALAGTAGASWALARYGSHSGRGHYAIVPGGGEAEALRGLPVAALRLSDGALSLLHRLGLRRIGEIVDRPRAPFAARFEGELLRRLDQALGRAPEPLAPVIPPPAYHAQASFLEPIASVEHVTVAAGRLLDELAPRLAQDDAGARVLRLLLFRVDGHVAALGVALAAPSRDPSHIGRLIALRLERADAVLDAGCGFEAAAIHVLAAEPLAPRQAGFAMREGEASADGLAPLIDRLRQRLGRGAVCQIHPHQSHLPERAEVLREVEVGRPLSVTSAETLQRERKGSDPVSPRPILLLPTPEPADVVALVPDGPPRRFRWRGVMHQVAEAEGPERIAPEWWRRSGEAERDYYVVEDTAGRRFWLFRHGLFGGGATPKWFVHGVFG
jgi:protein ImuB